MTASGGLQAEEVPLPGEWARGAECHPPCLPPLPVPDERSLTQRPLRARRMNEVSKMGEAGTAATQAQCHQSVQLSRDIS